MTQPCVGFLFRCYSDPKYNAQALKRFSAATRHAMLACLLVEAQKSLLDHLVTMHDQFVTGMARRSRNAFEERLKINATGPAASIWLPPPSCSGTPSTSNARSPL
jgi:hypothetical protein